MSSADEEWEEIEIDEAEPPWPEVPPVPAHEAVPTHEQVPEPQPTIARPQGIEATDIIRRGVHSWLEKAVGWILTALVLLVFIFLLAWIFGASPGKLIGCLFEEKPAACMWATKDEDDVTDPEPEPGVEGVPEKEADQGTDTAPGSEAAPGTETAPETENPDS